MDAEQRTSLRARVSYARLQKLAGPEGSSGDPRARRVVRRHTAAEYEEGVKVLMASRGQEVQELIGHVRKAGFKVVKTGANKHYKIQTKQGQVVTDDNGPLLISSSPSDFRWRDLAVSRLMQAGVLKQNPYKATGKQNAGRGPLKNDDDGAGGNGDGKKKGAHLQSEEVRERARAAAAKVRDTRSASAVEGTAKLRSRFEPVVPHLGGWAQGAGPRARLWNTPMRVLTVSELAEVVHHWAATRGRLELPRDKVTKQLAEPKQVEAAVRGLKAGATISEKWQPLISVFLDDLWRDEANPERALSDPRQAAARYLDLLREQRGIIAPPETPAPLEPAPLIPLRRAPDPEPEPEQPLLVGPAYELRPPALAMRVAWLAGKAGESLEATQDLYEQVAEFEFTKQKEEMWQRSQSSAPTSSGSDPTRSTRTM